VSEATVTDREPEAETTAEEPAVIDPGGEPEPEWVAGIRRARRERAERLARLLGDRPEDPRSAGRP
jgi:hypothetical protein